MNTSDKKSLKKIRTKLEKYKRNFQKDVETYRANQHSADVYEKMGSPAGGTYVVYRDISL